jgi:hypothetical protein
MSVGAMSFNYGSGLARYRLTGSATVLSFMFLAMQYELLNQSGNNLMPLDELQLEQQMAKSSSLRPSFQ